jgi:cytochrome c oxidase cbb3-type subunit 3
VAPFADSQPQGAAGIVPYSQEEAGAGAVIFRSRCAGCHGKEGAGGSGPDLTTTLRHGATDEALSTTITKGIAGSAMPAFPLDDREVRRLVAYVRSLSEWRTSGDPVRGAIVFRTSGCLSCHATNSGVGTAGPDLSDVVQRRSLAQLEQAILHPASEAPQEYWSVRARTKDGHTVSGIRLNEDTFSIQIRGPDGHLRSLNKGDLAQYELVRSSNMPSYEGKLNRSDFQDLLAYLIDLRGRRAK